MLNIENLSPTEIECGKFNALQINPRGPLLIRLIRDAARRKGETVEQLAHNLGVTPGYIHQLNSGIKQLRTVSPSFIHATAKLLQLPPAIVMMLAGSLTPSDWLPPNQQHSTAEGIRVLDMLEDPRWTTYKPSASDRTDPELISVQLCLYLAYSGCARSKERNTPRLLAHINRILLRVGLDNLDDSELEAIDIKDHNTLS